MKNKLLELDIWLSIPSGAKAAKTHGYQLHMEA